MLVRRFAMVLRLMTYNLRVAAPRDGEPSWAERRDAVASMIRFHDPDVVGVQEALPGMLADLDDRLAAYDWVGTGRTGEGGEHCALFYRPDRLAPARHDTFWLSNTPAEPGSRDWGAAYPRVATWMELPLSASAPSLYVVNTHFDHDSAEARRESARVLRDQMDAIAGRAPVVLLGDLNASPDTAPYRLLTRENESPPLRDALHESIHPHHGPVDTFNGFGSTVQPDGRIDYVFVRGPLRVQRHGTLTDRWNGHFPSDHCPVLAELVVPDDA
jgi:endonuclease/exonuclease/phosphatase family metal-dependent hydrolase